MIKQVCFDLDGVLVNLVQAHYEALNTALLLHAGFTISKEQHETAFNGLSTKTKLKKLILDGRVQPQIFSDIMETKKIQTITKINNLQPDPQKIAMLKYLKQHDIKTICVSNAIRQTIQSSLKKIGVHNYFDLFVSNEDTSPFNKPNPGPYLYAMYLGGIGPKETLIVQDSQVGLAAAKASMAHLWYVKDPSWVTLKNMTYALGAIRTDGCCPWFIKLHDAVG